MMEWFARTARGSGSGSRRSVQRCAEDDDRQRRPVSQVFHTSFPLWLGSSKRAAVLPISMSMCLTSGTALSWPAKLAARRFKNRCKKTTPTCAAGLLMRRVPRGGSLRGRNNRRFPLDVGQAKCNYRKDWVKNVAKPRISNQVEKGCKYHIHSPAFSP